MRLRQHLCERARTLPVLAILAIGFALFLVYAFPGYMSPDTYAQLYEARTGEFSDAHPPLMAAQWWILDRIVAGPLLMLVLQGACMLAGLYLVLRKVLAPRAAAWTASAVFVFPPVLTTMAVIWKDSQMAAYLMLGTGLLLQTRLRTRVIGLCMLVFACASRHNGVAAVLPLVFFVFEWRTGVRWWKRTVISLAILIGIGAAGLAITRGLAKSHALLTTVYPDVVGMIACGDVSDDAQLRYILRGTPLVHSEQIQWRAQRLVEYGGAAAIVEGDIALFRNAGSPEEWDALYRARKDLFNADPLSYPCGHWYAFSKLLALDNEPLRAPVWNLHYAEDLVAVTGHAAGYSFAQEWLARAFSYLALETPIFRPSVYAIAALLLLVLCCRDRVTAGLLTSGLVYELSFFPASANPDYRYSHWMVTATIVAAIILFVQRRRTA